MNYLLGASIGIAGAGVMFLPSVVAHLRDAESFRGVSALNALALLALVCSMASVWFLVATGALWICAVVLAVASLKRGAQQVEAPNERR